MSALVNPGFCVRNGNVVDCGGSFIFPPMNEQNSTEAPASSETPAAPKKRSYLPISILLLAVSVGFAGYLKYEVWDTAAKTAEIRKELSEFETQISALKANPSVAAADLLNRNKATLEKDSERSAAQNYVTEFMRLHRDYDVDFDGFQFANGKINTVVSSRQTSAGVDPVDKVIRLIGDYRSGSGSAATSPFTLGDVKLVSGDNTHRTFSAEFKIK